MAQQPLPTTAPGTFVRAARLGVTFVNSTDHPISERRYQQALLLGAGWTRWPMYWERIEASPGVFHWNAYDQLVRADVEHGFLINAILMGRPSSYLDGSSISGLGAAVFTDGSDTPGPGKSINAANPWANFVFQAVNRYKPGGLLASQLNWPPQRGIRVWEAWNEPDLAMFWRGSLKDYVRLLKVTYLAAHHADPDAQVMFGGLAYNNPETNDWLARALELIAQDEARAAHNWYMDQVAVHSYTYARRSGDVVRRVRDNLARYGLSRPVWLNENGVPVWDDYPGPTWAASDPGARNLRATQQQQAAYVIQSAAYAWAEGAEVVIFHQLYDDCGNQASGTDFPPNDGSLCSGGTCAGDAHGLFRNLPDSTCFRQHPFPGSPRPAAFAYRLLAQTFGSVPFTAGPLRYEGQAVVTTFQQAGQHVTIAWSRTLQGASLQIPAQVQAARLYRLDGSETMLSAEDEQFTVSLAGATTDDFPFLYAGDGAGIGGAPVLIVERTGSGGGAAPAATLQYNPALVPFPVPAYPTRAPVLLTPGPVGPVQPLLPTVLADPALASGLPVTAMQPLPLTSPITFTVTWSAQSQAEIKSYIVWMRANGGHWQLWQETSATSAEFSGESGNVYEFAVWAVDVAGNWSANTELQPQAYTQIE